ncbi:hypothetical protein EV188_106292 [Actinomycetospora succinea]|uniref:Uncharacterized protein n=1 Tax=Actinomycetospora succinea TaxID=663603 RepID=A0A4R6V2H4_9PSEU|nr:hypothetical protein [Actinomycetospora succinea]TDQ54143.1 hypothetical protein EV188_106292 [Actinomycetospora succinea]
MSLAVPAAADRAALADVVARVVRLDPAAVVRLRAAGDTVALWAATPFAVLVTTAAPGRVEPADVTVMASDLLAALSVVDAPEVDPGRAVDDRWRGDLPAGVGWDVIGEIRADEIDAVVARTDAAGLDATAWEADGVRVPARCVVAVAGMGWPEGGAAVPVALSDDGAWMRLDAGRAAVVRHRRPALTVLM